MSSPPSVFVDSDVVISALISQKGAADYLLGDKRIKKFISNFSVIELKTVVKKLSLSKKRLAELINKRLKVISIGKSIQEVRRKYSEYTTDLNDAHVVEGAVKAKARFLVSYNLRHFKTEKIKRDFEIIALTPAMLLQYLRLKSN